MSWQSRPKSFHSLQEKSRRRSGLYCHDSDSESLIVIVLDQLSEVAGEGEVQLYVRLLKVQEYVACLIRPSLVKDQHPEVADS